MNTKRNGFLPRTAVNWRRKRKEGEQGRSGLIHQKKGQKRSWDKKPRSQLDFRGGKRHKKSE